jgi:hypothetical protein
MGLFKKNTAFCTLFVIFLLVFAGGTFLAVAQSGKLSKSKQQVTSAQSQLKGMLYLDPAPSTDNVAAAEQNVEQLRAELQKIRDNLQHGSRLTTSADGMHVMTGIQQYISEYQQEAAKLTHPGNGSELVGIETPADFAFGFETYIDEGVVPENAAAIPVLDKQRQILSYIVDQLMASDPVGIQSIQREVLEMNAPRVGKAGAAQKLSGFQINPAISARVPGGIDTLAFSLKFTGYTKSLRQFLNNLAKFDLPIVVRSIEVTRPSGSATTTTKKEAKTGVADIFSVFGGESATTKAPKLKQKPVISENVSSFTIILEFIEIVLPADSGEANS